MSSLQVSFTLGPRDLGHLRDLLREAAEAAAERSDEDLAAAALATARRVRDAEPPDYVADRLEALEGLAEMVRDPDYRLPGSVRKRARMAIAYFTEPDDAIPDAVPVLGFLDDAIMMELVVRELEDEVRGYHEFHRFRQQVDRRREVSPSERARSLEERRKRIRASIQERTSQAREQGRRRLRLW